MAGVIYLETREGLVAMEPREYELEELLQKLLAGDARLLGGASTGESASRRWILITREATIYGASGQPWAADHIFIDHEGVPTIVEVKRGSNTQIRREVIGQLLDYAANLAASTTSEAMRARYEEQAGIDGQDPSSALQAALGIEVSADEYWSVVAENLARGRIRGYFVADVIPEELRRVVDYLNRQLGENRYLALEVQRFQTADGVTTTLVPQIVAGSLEPPLAAGPRGLSGAPAVHVEYWHSLAGHLAERGFPLSLPKPPASSLFYIPLGHPGFRLCAWNLVRGGSGVTLAMRDSRAGAWFENQLQDRHRQQIEQALAPFGAIRWEAKTSDYAQVAVQRDDLNVSDKASWPVLQEWMADALDTMSRLFRPLARELSGSGSATGTP